MRRVRQLEPAALTEPEKAFRDKATQMFTSVSVDLIDRIEADPELAHRGNAILLSAAASAFWDLGIEMGLTMAEAGEYLRAVMRQISESEVAS
jgi:hypothetical protein